MTLKYSQILVAVDGSREAAWAFQKAIDIAVRNHATLNIVHIIDNRSFGLVKAHDRSTFQFTKHRAQELLDECEKTAKSAGVEKVNGLIEYGIPKVIIPRDLAEKVHADLIVCGATGLDAAERLIMGSVSTAIVRSASCDVLVVRTEEITEASENQ
ncbi:MAG TPA: universal stress protein [Planococcus sp. (in: firmicutes)]|nr:universal stress protein [Planococcus sp. (in: firmicutes)]